MSEQVIPVFYACDNSFVKYMVVSLKSLLCNASPDYRYRIHILHSDITEELQEKVRAMATEYAEICFHDVRMHLQEIAERLPIRDYYSNTTYYRMFIAEMFPEYDKALYIDSDTVVPGDISELYEKELRDNYVGAAHEQAMVQENVYGCYVEEVLGIDRNNYFNAGVLLINCKAFRENRLLEKFIELLGIYNFVVTQDEDYLNVLCKDKVLWIEQQWNTEMFGEIPYPEEEYKLIHYIMVSKPWHYADCRCGAFFWEYAKQTFAYEEIKEVLENYTDEEKERDLVSAKRLMQTAIYEINKKDNYLGIVKNGTTKSRERLLIVDKIAKYEREGRFDEDVEEDPPSKELLPEHVDYLRSSVKSKLKSKFAYSVARIFMNDMIAKKQLIIKDIKGLENYAGLQSGAVVTCNHFNAMDSFAMQIAYEASGQKKRKFYRVIREGNYTNFPGFYGMLMRNCNTFPLSSNKQTMRKFMKSVDAILTGGHFLLIYPEQSMWWNYRKPKPLKKGGFIMATKNNVPVLPCFITMEDSDVKDGDGFFVQEYTIHIGKPIYPDAKKKRSENVQAMMDENFACWKNIYEKTYGIPLQYADEEIRLPKKA
ncbi:MAG: 1-acyl-sn-glycerol-3-phosphate acyltransferase [Lachnospiraceae bacterium]|nr:1-acyl-sn-glycerol-3-phosphate acyltransferase [Lachnospiraceae bacterium]